MKHDQKSVGFVKTKQFRYEKKIKLDGRIEFGPIDVAYETYGTLNQEKNNAVLITHTLTSDAHAAGFHSEKSQKPGWWDSLIGPGKAFDTNQYFIICSNVLGGCMGTTGPASINPETGKEYGADFPVVTIGDMVEVQAKLIDHLGIDKLLCVAGGSMGGVQALEWALRFPDRVQSIMAIAATARLSPQSIAFHAVGRNAIISDPNWREGNYYGKEKPSVGLSIARMIAHITYLSDESMHKKFGRRLQFDENFSFRFDTEFEVESYLDYQGRKFVERFDANSYLYVTKSLDYFDAARYYGDGDLVKALSRITARVLVLSFSTDWLFPPYQSQELTDALIQAGRDVTYLNIESPFGHDSFLLETETEGKIVSAFLSATFGEL